MPSSRSSSTSALAHHGRNSGYVFTSATSAYISRGEYQSRTDFFTCFTTTPRPPNTARDPPGGSDLAWGGPARRPATIGLAQIASYNAEIVLGARGPI